MKFLNTHLSKKNESKNETLTTVSFLSQINTQKKKNQQEFYTLEDLQKSNEKKLKRFVYSFLFLTFTGFICNLFYLNQYKTYMNRLESVKLFLMINFYIEILVGFLSILLIFTFYQKQLSYIKIPQNYKSSVLSSNMAIVFLYTFLIFLNVSFVVLTKIQSNRTAFFLITQSRIYNVLIYTIQCILLCVYNHQRYDLDFSVNFEDETQDENKEDNFNGSFALNLSFNKNTENPFKYKQKRKSTMNLDPIDENKQEEDIKQHRTPKKLLFKFENQNQLITTILIMNSKQSQEDITIKNQQGLKNDLNINYYKKESPNSPNVSFQNVDSEKELQKNKSNSIQSQEKTEQISQDNNKDSKFLQEVRHKIKFRYRKSIVLKFDSNKVIRNCLQMILIENIILLSFQIAIYSSSKKFQIFKKNEFGIISFVLWVLSAFFIPILIKKKLIRIAVIFKILELITCALFYGFLVAKMSVIFFCLPSEPYLQFKKIKKLKSLNIFLFVVMYGIIVLTTLVFYLKRTKQIYCLFILIYLSIYATFFNYELKKIFEVTQMDNPQNHLTFTLCKIKSIFSQTFLFENDLIKKEIISQYEKQH